MVSVHPNWRHYRDAALPRGVERGDPIVGSAGYEKWYRDRVWDSSPDFSTTWLHSERTHRRWQQRLVDNGHLGRSPARGGRPAVLRKQHILHLMLYLIAWPDANNSEVIINVCHNYPELIGKVKDYHVSRALHQKGPLKGLEFTRRMLRYIAKQRCEVRRELYRSRAPPHGIAGVNPERFVDTDESFFYLSSANRKRGRAPVGQDMDSRGPRTGREREGLKYTLILSISIHGVVCFELHTGEGGVNGDVYADYIENTLFPALDAQFPEEPMVLLEDNLNSHAVPYIQYLLSESRHTRIARAPYACVDAPIENPFFYIKSFLRFHTWSINAENLEYYIKLGVARIRPWHCKAWFRRTRHLPPLV